MAEVDTSSYPKPPALPAQQSLLGTVNTFQDTAIKQQQFQSNQLSLVDAGLKYLSRAIGSLGPDASKDQYLGVGQDMVKLGLVPPNTLNIYADRLAKAPTSQDFYNEIMTATADHQQQLDYHLGRNQGVNVGNAVQPVVTSPKPGFGMRSTGLPIAVNPPPTQEEYNPKTGQKRYRGPQPAEAASGMVTAPPPGPGFTSPLPVSRPNVTPSGPINDPAIPGNSSSLGGTVTGATADAPTFNDRYSSTGLPTGGFAAPSPLFEEGKAQLSKDQSEATARMMRIKPALQALPLMQSKGFLSGPGSEQFTKAVAALKTFGLVNTANENDPTAIRQEVTKKLAQYVQGNPVGQRSDAAQILAEASNPNPKEHILPALMKLTKDAVALDRVQASIPNVFTASGEKDLSKYKPYAAKFPQSIDERAFTLDLEPEETSTSLVDGMAKKLKSSNKKDQAEADKFFRSLSIAKGQGFYQ